MTIKRAFSTVLLTLAAASISAAAGSSIDAYLTPVGLSPICWALPGFCSADSGSASAPVMYMLLIRDSPGSGFTAYDYTIHFTAADGSVTRISGIAVRDSVSRPTAVMVLDTGSGTGAPPDLEVTGIQR